MVEGEVPPYGNTTYVYETAYSARVPQAIFRGMDFIDNNPNVTAKDIYQFAGKMMDYFGLSGLEIHPYRK